MKTIRHASYMYRTAAIALAAMSALGFGVSCKKEAGKDGAAAGSSSGNSGGGRGGRGAGGANLMFTVDTLQVEQKKIDYIITAPGTLEAFERVQVTARVAGVVDRVAFSEGQTVKKGDVLVVIDSERFQLSANSAKAALDKAQAAQKDMEGMVARREGASDQHPGLIPGEELESYRTKSLTAKADTAVANENLKIAQLNLRDSAVRAPIEGVIQTRTVETGQYVNQGYVMATLLRNDPMLLRFQVEPLEAPRLKAGMPATFTLRETQRTFEAKITLVAAAADPATHMVGVTAEVASNGHDYWLRPGSFCDVAIDGNGTREAPLIPRTATRATDHGYITYVVENDVATERVVKLGLSSKDGWVEVKEGIKAGDWIVVRGAEALTTGAKVRPNRLASFNPLAASTAMAPASASPSGNAGAPPASSGTGRRNRGGKPPGTAP